MRDNPQARVNIIDRFQIPLVAGYRAQVMIHRKEGLHKGYGTTLMFGQGRFIGAGYVKGFTAFFKVRANDRNRPGSMGSKILPLQVGVTRNANKVPYWIH